MDEAIAKLLRGELLDEALVEIICENVKHEFAKESNVKVIFPPVSVVGDLHGQFYDLLELFKIGGDIPFTNYLFLGDYVDRGAHSVETILFLICLKLRYSDRITMLRGNHESRQITQVYGFYAECVRKYSSVRVWTAITNMFDFLPIGAVIAAPGRHVLAVHGGLSPSINTIDQLRILNRFGDIPHEGPIADLMWSDPDPEKEGFLVSPRGAGYVFGHDVVSQFLHVNKLDHICRAHQLCMTGYQLLFEDECMSTVWSAPNYCYRFGNVASIMEVGEHGEREYNVFSKAPIQERIPPPNVSKDELYMQYTREIELTELARIERSFETLSDDDREWLKRVQDKLKCDPLPVLVRKGVEMNQNFLDELGIVGDRELCRSLARDWSKEYQCERDPSLKLILHALQEYKSSGPIAVFSGGMGRLSFEVASSGQEVYAMESDKVTRKIIALMTNNTVRNLQPNVLETCNRLKPEFDTMRVPDVHFVPSSVLVVDSIPENIKFSTVITCDATIPLSQLFPHEKPELWIHFGQRFDDMHGYKKVEEHEVKVMSRYSNPASIMKTFETRVFFVAKNKTV